MKVIAKLFPFNPSPSGAFDAEILEYVLRARVFVIVAPKYYSGAKVVGGWRGRQLQNYFHSIHPELDQYCDYTININIVNTLNRKHLEPHIDPVHHQYCVWSFPPMREINK